MNQFIETWYDSRHHYLLQFHSCFGDFDMRSQGHKKAQMSLIVQQHFQLFKTKFSML